ncbi:MAG: TlpA family protein disulfide reductase [bacterium]
MRFVFVFLLLFSGTVSAESEQYPDVSWQLEDPFGDITSFNQNLTDKPTVLFFWASWCPFCHKLMPGVQRIYDEFDHQRINFYTINVWETGDAMAYIFDHDHTFPVLIDGEEVAAQYGVKGTPGLFVLNKDGLVIFKRKGKLTPAQVEESVRKALLSLLEK